MRLPKTWLFSTSLCLAVTAQASDRIFANSFEPCCRISGTVSGLTGAGLVLRLAAGDIVEEKTIAGNGLYDFRAPVPPGTDYALSTKTQAAGQTCSFVITIGTMGSSDINNADVACSDNIRWDSGLWGQTWN